MQLIEGRVYLGHMAPENRSIMAGSYSSRCSHVGWSSCVLTSQTANRKQREHAQNSFLFLFIETSKPVPLAILPPARPDPLILPKRPPTAGQLFRCPRIWEHLIQTVKLPQTVLWPTHVHVHLYAPDTYAPTYIHVQTCSSEHRFR